MRNPEEFHDDFTDPEPGDLRNVSEKSRREGATPINYQFSSDRDVTASPRGERESGGRSISLCRKRKGSGHPTSWKGGEGSLRVGIAVFKQRWRPGSIDVLRFIAARPVVFYPIITRLFISRHPVHNV